MNDGAQHMVSSSNLDRLRAYFSKEEAGASIDRPSTGNNLFANALSLLNRSTSSESIFLSEKKMGDHHYVAVKNPCS